MLTKLETERVFRPNYIILCLIANDQYGNRRQERGFEHLDDLEHLPEHVENVKQGVQGVGVQPSEVIELRNIDYK